LQRPKSLRDWVTGLPRKLPAPKALLQILTFCRTAKSASPLPKMLTIHRPPEKHQ
jgi:hypothetical protein